MTTIKERIENLEEGVSSIVKVEVADKLVKIEEIINKLSKALLFI